MDGNPVGQKKRGRYSIYSLVLIVLASVLFISGYTFVLQKMHSDSILENAVEQNSARTDAMQTGVSGFITREDFTEINSMEDMDTELYQTLQRRLNQIRTMNNTRYFYTAKRGSDGRLIYLVDGLAPDADDFAYPGTYIEDEMIPFIDKALAGETVYSQEIIDTTWGHIFTACYPVRENGTGEVMGALCIEMDMEPTYEFISERNRIALIVGTIGVACILVIIGLAFIYIRSYNKNQEKQQEMLEKAAEAAYSVNRAKSAFLFNMSHDIRTPMNAIIGYVELARRHLNEPDKLNEYMDNISSCGQKLLSLLNNVLDLVRIENNKTIVEETIENVGDTVSSCITMFRNAAEKKNQTITYKQELSEPYVYVDAGHLSEIIMNILSNAVKYTGNGGSISVTARQENSDREGWCNTIVSVSDTGIGISEEFQQHIFEEFSRERSSTVSGIDGAGLGMGIVKKLVDLMGGEITLQSRLGEGSTFTVTIPCRISSAEEAQAKRSDSTLDKDVLVGKRILLAEDNDLNAEIATELLTEEGLKVERAADGVECVEKIEKAEAGYYDLILMDIQMPIMNGYDAATKIRRMEDKQKSCIPIIAMTANAFSEDKNKAIEVGMNDHVAKPIDMNVVLPALIAQFNK